MKRLKYDVVVLGGGAAGMGAIRGALSQGVSVLLIEREASTGGVLNQCIHNGFGIHIFNEELSGPEFHEMYLEKIGHFDGMYETTVLRIDENQNLLHAISKSGVYEIEYGALVLATGARERPFEALRIPGTRPAGIFTAGLAQHFVNLENRLPGRRAVILGSGDIGLIMARRLTLEGVEVEGVYEIMPYQGGLTRNIVQCLDDFNIPLHLSTSVVKVHGKERLEGVTVAKFENGRPVEGSERFIKCDTLVASVGLIPENDLVKNFLEIAPDEGANVDDLMRTNIPNIFAAGNNVCIHDLVDFVTLEGENAGKNAALASKGEALPSRKAIIKEGQNVRVLSTKYTTASQPFKMYIRVARPMGVTTIYLDDERLKTVPVAKPSEMIELTLDPSKYDMKGKVVLSAVEVRK
jgi:NADPH-dependent 2,4-dienoyl-CoA reductase/sulfur reductase-like enzyme